MEQLNLEKIAGLPVGYTSRPTTLDDAERYAEILNAEHAEINQQRAFDAESIRSDWQSPKFSLVDSSRAVLDADGYPVAFVTVWDEDDPPVHVWVSWTIDPAYWSDALALALLRWAEMRAQSAIDRCPPGTRVTLHSGAAVEHEGRQRVMQAYGMNPIRYFLHMRIDMEAVPPAPQIPDGLRIRAVRYPEELEATVETLVEAFRDHWGFIERPFDQEMEFWHHMLSTDKLFDPALWWIAEDVTNGKFAAICLCRIEEWSEPTASYVWELGVRPEYRKRGLALAMLHHSFGEFWKRDRKTVTLYVDGDSLTGAVRLYERAGMHPDRRHANYEKELRPGEELATTSAR